jgi:uncharacterized membrane protein YcaP (DUF421 family)
MEPKSAPADCQQQPLRRELQMLDAIARVDWAALFVPTHSLAEMVVRGTLMYLGLFLIFRFMVGRQSSAIGIADLLVIVIIADAAQNAFAKEYQSVTEGITLVLTIVFWDLALDWLAYHNSFFAWLCKPPPLPLVKDGRMLRANMRRELITADELISQARQQGIERIEEVRTACLEGNGEISFVKESPDDHEGGGKRRRKDVA